mmetsp:Transcript_147594/g.257443  ORF Transcript_147594/g.257443 Transcript_147594/m.257443 type:complete len:380 (-) Transcript_147594:129-1268(-)
MPEILYYDPTLGPVRHAYEGFFVAKVRAYTVVKQVFTRSTFWFFLALHLTIYFLCQYNVIKGALKEHLHINWGFIKITTAATGFLNVLYANQCYQQYTDFHFNVRQIFGSVHEFILEFRLNVSPVDERSVIVVVRYLLVTLLLFFLDLRREEPIAQIGTSDWNKLIDCGLLRRNEVEFLQSEDWSPRQTTLILLHWIANITRLGFQKGNFAKPEITPAQALRDMIDDLIHVKRHLACVRDNIGIQVPYPYFHLLNLMLCVNIFLWAVFLGVDPSIWSPLVFFSATFIFMSLMELAVLMSNPFGDDDVDFPLEEWLTDITVELLKISDYTQADDNSTWMVSVTNTEKSLEAVDAVSPTKPTNFLNQEDVPPPPKFRHEFA